MGVRDTDRGMGRLLEGLAELEGGVRITVGVHADDGAAPHRGSGGTVADVAAATELGTADEAPHSFVRATIDGKTGLGRDLADAAARALQGESPATAFQSIADELASEMRAAAPSVTGQLRGAIAGRVAV